MTIVDLSKIFPNINAGAGHRKTSNPTELYNCVAWALNDDTRWWEPGPRYLYWPKPNARPTLMEYLRLFREKGFENCPDGSLEAEYEKVAIYTKTRRFKHVARQLPNGRWTSKLGALHDVVHDLDAVAGDEYGSPTHFLRRQTNP